MYVTDEARGFVCTRSACHVFLLVSESGDADEGDRGAALASVENGAGDGSARVATSRQLQVASTESALLPGTE